MGSLAVVVLGISFKMKGLKVNKNVGFSSLFPKNIPVFVG